MEPIKRNCETCKRDFWVIAQEKQFLDKMGLPLPVDCPGCRSARRLRQRGERTLYRTTCQNCNKSIIVSFDPQKETRKILCKECHLDYFEKNSALITE